VIRRSCLVAVALLLSAGAVSAPATQKWTAGWDNFRESLNYKQRQLVCKGDDGVNCQ
jgi:hypothetical protein